MSDLQEVKPEVHSEVQSETHQDGNTKYTTITTTTTTRTRRRGGKTVVIETAEDGTETIISSTNTTPATSPVAQVKVIETLEEKKTVSSPSKSSTETSTITSKSDKAALTSSSNTTSSTSTSTTSSNSTTTIITFSSMWSSITRITTTVTKFVRDINKGTFPLVSYPSTQVLPWPVGESVLYVHGPGWKGDMKTSSDPSCLAWQAWLTTRGLPFRIEHITEPEASSTHRLPFLASADGTCYSGDRIDVFLEEHCGKEAIRTDKAADARAFAALLTSRLKPAVIHHLWCEPANYPVTAKVMGPAHPFPISSLLMASRQASWQEELTILAPGGVYTRADLYTEADSALEALSARLGSSPWLLSQEESDPTYADCVAFSFLHPILAAPLPEPELRLRVEKYPNLVAYTRRAHDHWFPTA